MAPPTRRLTTALAGLLVTSSAALKRLLWTGLMVAGLLPGLAMAQGQQCANFQSNRQPFFGELHLHTQYSADAATLDTRNTPSDAYRFAKGEKLGLPPFVNTCTNNQCDSGPPNTGPVSSHFYCFPPDRCEFTATRTIQFPQGRELDFAAITDHAEWFGETNICFWEEKEKCEKDADCKPEQTGHICFGTNLSATGEGICVPRGYASEDCILAREELAKLRTGLGTELFAAYVTTPTIEPDGTVTEPQRAPFCQEPGAGGKDTCIFQAQNVWGQIQQDAADAYQPCQFTSFIAYEYTGMPAMSRCKNDGAPCLTDADCTGGQSCVTDPNKGANNLHRNIIFKNDDVVDLPITYMEAPTSCGQGSPECNGALGSPLTLLQDLAAQCGTNTSHSQCDFISIPHNSNISGGAMFVLPESPDEATLRSERERLVELFQIKGSSECRFSAQHPGAWGTIDELCNFENMSFGKLNGKYLSDPNATNVSPKSYVRNALKDGMLYQQENGVNPFMLGFVGALDNHNGTPGASEEVQYAKTGAHGDLSFAVSGQILNEANFLGLETNGGGMTGVWAQENTRDSIFAALKRRETYATSGTRPVVRFFGGFDLPNNICKQGDFAAQGYAGGVPMGGTLPHSQVNGAPRFAVSALMDPGWQGHPGTKLQSIQIIKGWVAGNGQTREKTYEVVANPLQGTSVNLRTCKPEGGSTDFCATWTDPNFNPNQHAFYYARVLESPSCRWNQYYCLARGVDCSKPPDTTSDIVSYTEYEYQQCCSDFVPKTVQQRAWTSPIWYEP